MPHVTFIPLVGFRIRERELLEVGMSRTASPPSPAAFFIVAAHVRHPGTEISGRLSHEILTTFHTGLRASSGNDSEWLVENLA